MDATQQRRLTRNVNDCLSATRWRWVNEIPRRRKVAKQIVFWLSMAFIIFIVGWMVYAFIHINHVMENPQRYNPGWQCEPETDQRGCEPRT